MEHLLKYLSKVVDIRQERKVWHKMSDIIALVFFAMLAGADDWTAYEIFGREHEAFLRRYLELPAGIPSHNTIQRVFAMVSSEFLQKFQVMWNEMLNSDEGEKIKRLLAIDGKTQCGNGNKNQKANHIVSAVDENGFCLGEKRVNEKTNEITAIPELLDDLNIKGNIVTIDAMGTQTEIAKKIRKKRADYVLALKKNQKSLYEDVKLYFEDPAMLSGCDYTKTLEKARSSIEKREYWQTEDIGWLRYFISSLPVNAKEVARAIRGHWMIESFHWHLDVTFHEDENRTLEKQAAFNQNILRKLALAVLKIFDTGKKLSVRLKRFSVSTNPEKHIENILAL